MSAVMGTRHLGTTSSQKRCRARRRAWWLLTPEQPIESRIRVRQVMPDPQGSQGDPGSVRGVQKPLHGDLVGRAPGSESRVSH